jgi:hypothetical protein
MLTKTTKIASALALALATGSAMAANTVSVGTTAIDKTGAGALTTVNEAIEGSDYATFDADTLPAPGVAHYVTYHAETSGVLNNGFLKFNFDTDLALFSNNGAQEFFLLRTVSGGVAIDQTANQLETVGTVFAVETDASGDYTSITFQIAASANIGIDDVLVLATAEDTTNNVADLAANVNFTVDSGATLSDSGATTFSVSVEGQNPSAGAHAPSNATGDIITSTPALSATALTAASSKVDLANNSDTFIEEAGFDLTDANGSDTSTTVSAARGLILDQTNSGVDFPTTLDANDLIEIIVSTDAGNCEAVNGDDAGFDGNAVRTFDVINGANSVASTANVDNNDHATCTFTISGNFGGGSTLDDSLDLADGVGVAITIDGTEADIVSSTWNTKLRVDFNSNVTAGDWVDYVDQTSHEWDATISGPRAVTPYVYAFNNNSSVNSIIQIANYAGSSRDVGMKVNLVELEYNGTEWVRTTLTPAEDYYLGTVAADSIMQVTGDDIIDLLISPSTAKTADEGYNVTPVALDKTKLYHMSVEFTLVDDGALNAAGNKYSDNDYWHIAVQNKSGGSRADAPVNYSVEGNNATTGRDDHTN